MNGIVSRFELSFIYLVLEFSPTSCVDSSIVGSTGGSVRFPKSKNVRIVSTGTVGSRKFGT